MPVKQMLVLANSWKHHPYSCVAGREIVERDNNYEIGPWIRPVSPRGEEGALHPKEIALDIGRVAAVWDFVSLSLSEKAETFAQPENWLIDGSKWSSTNHRFQRCPLSFIEQKPANLWIQPGKKTDRVGHDYLEKKPPLSSLYCIHPEELSLRFYTDQWGKAKRRGVFTYRGIEYDLSLTDPSATAYHCHRMPAEGDEPLEVTLDTGSILLCVSLAGAYRGEHYKLIATVLSE